MNILLLNTNPVVSRLVALCMRDDTITFREVPDISDTGDTTYDIIFVDDASYDGETAAFLDALDTGKIVFFSRRDSGEEVGGAFDYVIKKPFLPSQIQAVIDEVSKLQLHTPLPEEVPDDVCVKTAEEEKCETSDDEHFIFPLAASGEENDEEVPLIDGGEEEPSPKVLDSHEIEQIKALLEESDEEISPLEEEDTDYEARKVEVITRKLEEDGLEIVAEEEIIESLSGKEPAKTEKKEKKRKKKKKKQKEDVYTFEEALLAAIENMKPKQIKKLLKNAEVHISIKFKDDV